MDALSDELIAAGFDVLESHVRKSSGEQFQAAIVARCQKAFWGVGFQSPEVAYCIDLVSHNLSASKPIGYDTIWLRDTGDVTHH